MRVRGVGGWWQGHHVFYFQRVVPALIFGFCHGFKFLVMILGMDDCWVHLILVQRCSKLGPGTLLLHHLWSLSEGFHLLQPSVASFDPLESRLLKHMVNLRVCFQFSCVGNTPLVACVGKAVMNEVELVGGAKNRTQTVETVPLGYCVGENCWVGVSVGWVQLDIELVCEDFFGVASKDQDCKNKYTK